MTIKDFKKWLEQKKVPEDAEIALWQEGYGSCYECTDVSYNNDKNQVYISC